jgi:hypothetical protein
VTTLPVASDLIAVIEHLQAIQATLAEARAQQREVRSSLAAIERTLACISAHLELPELRVHIADAAP